MIARLIKCRPVNSPLYLEFPIFYATKLKGTRDYFIMDFCDGASIGVDKGNIIAHSLSDRFRDFWHQSFRIVYSP